MSKHLNDLFKLTFPENLKKEAGLSSTGVKTLDDLGDFAEEREKICRSLEDKLKSTLRIDYSNFGNHTFFNSAVSKLAVAKDNVLNDYPFDGSQRDKDYFILSSSGYEEYIFDQWPRFVGYSSFNGSDHYISASDADNKLLLGSSSLYVSAWIQPAIADQNIILQVVSASIGDPIDANSPLRWGYDFYLSGASDPHIKFTLYSGSVSVSVSAAYVDFTASYNNVAVIYDHSASLLSMHVNSIVQASASVSGSGITAPLSASIEWQPVTMYVGSGSLFYVPASSSNYDLFSGSLNELRVLHTGSSLYHVKNYTRPIDAESFVKLNYKFNESISGTGSIDSTIVDYSKSALHGFAVNHVAGFRVSGSVMESDPGDPILFSFHSGVIAFTSSLELSASAYDDSNNNLIFRLIPEGIRTEDEKEDSLLNDFSLAMARFFDDLKSYFDQFDNLRITNYSGFDETPDTFLSTAMRYFGWRASEHFGDAAGLQYFFGEQVVSNTGSLETSPFELRNEFWRRTLNNLPYLLKTKGKRYGLDGFFNVLGLNRDNFSIKEYGYLPGTAIKDTRIFKEKAVSLLGIGTGSLGTLSSSFIKAPLLLNDEGHSEYTVETLVQLPHASASYSGSLTVLSGALWQFIDPDQVTGSFGLYWNISSVGASSGTFYLSGSDAIGSASEGGIFSSSDVAVFDGRIAHIAAGLRSDQIPFIEIRSIDRDEINFSASFSGSVALSGVFTGSKYDFIVGAYTGSIFSTNLLAQGFFGEVRVWDRALSGSELDDHALHFESIGTVDTLGTWVTGALRAHWPLNDNIDAGADERLDGILDLSRNGRTATGSQFPVSDNPFEKRLLEYNSLSPAMDLKWTDNKVRVRSKTELTLDDVSVDTNEVSLEFNLVDHLNEDISKIFSTFDEFNNVIGKPVNKYRDEYSDLEGYRRAYFDRLGTSIHFNQFFDLFKWFDRKLSDSIKQMLPARVRFIGGEQVVESHALERNKYGLQYPLFKSPKDIVEGVISASADVSGAFMNTLASGSMKGTYAATIFERGTKFTSHAGLEGPRVRPRDASVVFEAGVQSGSSGTRFVTRNLEGAAGMDRNKFPFLEISASVIDTTGSVFNDIAIDRSGAIYAVGRWVQLAGENNWVVRKSHISSSTDWSTVDNFNNSGTGDDEALSVAIDGNDIVYVVGYGQSGSIGNTSWILRSSSDNGTTWFSDTYNTLSGGDDRANDVAVDSSNNVIVVGFHSGSTGERNWLARRSTDLGDSWTNVDDYSIGTGIEEARGVAIDSSDIVYVAGRETVSGQGTDWLVRSSSNGIIINICPRIPKICASSS